MSRLHQHNLKQAAAILAAYGVCFLHGDGNMFITDEASNFRQEYSNPDAEESKQRLVLRAGDRVPETVEEAERLMAANTRREKQIKKEKDKASSQKVTTIAVDIDKPAIAQPEDLPTKDQVIKAHQSVLEQAAFLDSKQEGLNDREKQLDQQMLAAAAKIKTQTDQATAALQQKADALKAQQESMDARAAELDAKEKALAKKNPKQGDA